MPAARYSVILWMASFLMAMNHVPLCAQAKYSGGSGTAPAPYQIATVADLVLLGDTQQDYDKHFILTADLDLAPDLPGRKIWTKAPIAPNADGSGWSFQGTSFTGIFDGNDHRISHLTIAGKSYLGLFGRLGYGAEVKDLGVVDGNLVGSGIYIGGLVGYNDGGVFRCHSTGTVGGGDGVGGLVGGSGGMVMNCRSAAAVTGRNHVGGLLGYDYYGRVAQCFSASTIDGTDYLGGLLGYVYYGEVVQCFNTGTVRGHYYVGGLLGGNHFGEVTNSYNTGAVHGIAYAGGLLGDNGGSVVNGYSVGAVSGEATAGGLVGENRGDVIQCFWDSQTSGQASRRGDGSRPTSQMQTAETFLEAGWDFMGETVNGTQDVWWIDEGQDYPRLWWE